jgi:hypothetical protein
MTALASASLWMEIGIDCVGSDVQVSGRTCRDQVVARRSLGPEMSVERLQAFGKRVADAARQGPLPDAVIGEARAIRRAIMEGEGRLDRLHSELHGAADGAPVLVRFLIASTELQSVPWEALCEPTGDNDLWGISTSFLIVRGVRDPEPARIRRVSGALHVLVVAPLGGLAIDTIHEALAERIATNEVAFLPPIGPDQARVEYLFDRLGKDPMPHILHFVGHGGMHGGKPALQLADDASGDPTWIDAELLAAQLRAAPRDRVQLIVLEACEGARPGEFSSAAEALCRSGAQAVVAHLWPVRADLARDCSARFYGALARDGARPGDAAAALNHARRALFTLRDHTAQAFSPVLYLRGEDARLFEFVAEPTVVPPVDVAADVARRRRLAKIVAGAPPFTAIIGDRWPHDRAAFEHLELELRAELSRPRRSEPLPPCPPGLASSALMERAALVLGEELLKQKFQATFKQVTRPDFIDAIARELRAGPHITLLRTPLLEHAVQAAQPDVNLYVVQPNKEQPVIYCRDAGASEWRTLPDPPEDFDPHRDIMILRLYCGYMPADSFAAPMLIEDHYLASSGNLTEALYGHGRDGDVAEVVRVAIHQRPALVMGLLIHAWPHRKLLNDVFEDRKLPDGSLAVVADEADERIWRLGRGLPGHGAVDAIPGSADDLNRWLAAIAAEQQIARA